MKKQNFNNPGIKKFTSEDYARVAGSMALRQAEELMHLYWVVLLDQK